MIPSPKGCFCQTGTRISDLEYVWPVSSKYTTSHVGSGQKRWFDVDTLRNAFSVKSALTVRSSTSFPLVPLIGQTIAGLVAAVGGAQQFDMSPVCPLEWTPESRALLRPSAERPV